ncbi:related to 1,3-beta-glucanosyltransferase GAS4 [Saccharomycodes ludwigii]|uniref:1,3-beta-glucanosyltransferase n=1 Tax=Saccharomycodes ludwigii TaxID=36035 RepID=A0A376B8W9_9ASCO|nr:hypothetical protein SCDLUD_005015 [Saccharomycodes ludwigii]KAH3898692.1 hypothetical protein SCDLUD_005015 [Saccharomycodes ludwigii]SSD61019.1 related to 1,3-beta-glucanosyltransferase GAS4 [Saccharomycodes ludwigii]
MSIKAYLFVLGYLLYKVVALVHPIEIYDKFFIDSITRQPFYIRGVDYQPGGASGITKEKDPLSDPNICARDILLFQDLGINTVRVYSINPDLNHDICMSILASAGIYLVLDVNSPLPGQHLNRYQPWTTYNNDYLEHVFKVIKQFSGYNNTLGFFAGNEVVNDKRSAKNSPTFIKQLINDMKLFMKLYCPRTIPVGYSAADDLKYRISLSKYLACADYNLPEGSVDFYGVNTYQWCGDQTFHSSGYDILVEDYEEYSKPVFFSEFGCNKVTPRNFQEVEAIFSPAMCTVFTGGLVYEFSQETNKYGLVEIDTNNDVHLLSDFKALKERYTATLLPSALDIIQILKMKNSKSGENTKVHGRGINKRDQMGEMCEKQYENLEITKETPPDLAAEVIESGIDVEKGEFVLLKEKDLQTTHKIYDIESTLPYKSSNGNKIQILVDIFGISDEELQQLSTVSNEARMY